jgi:hypothetical protein
MKENLSINNTERNLKRWKPLSKEIDIEFEASKIIEEISKKNHPKTL